MPRQGLIQYGWSMEELSTLMQGEMGKEMKDFSDGTFDLNKKIKDITEQIGELSGNPVVTSQQVQQVDELRSKLTGVYAEMEGIKEKLDKDKLGFKNTKAAKDRIAELKVEAGKLSHQITKMGEKPYLSEAQKKQLTDLRGQLAETKTAMEELNTAHEKSTKGILFDMLQQRLELFRDARCQRRPEQSGER